MGLLAAGEVPEFTPLAGGVSSLIVRVDSTRGTLCIKRALARLKVAAIWTAPLERNGAEVAWMRVAAGVVPGIVPQILGEDSEAWTFAMAYLEPADYPVWKSQLLAGRAERETAVAVAGALVRVHHATARDERCAAAFANDANFLALRLDPYFGAAADANADCARILRELIESTAGTRLALVHGDVSPKNILVGQRGPVLLDAECAWYGDPAFDVAFCLNHLLLKCAVRPQAAPAYLACFDAFCATYLDGVHWEPAVHLESRACRLLAAMLLARVDGKSPVEYLTEEAARSRVRNFARSLLLGGSTSLAEIRHRWSREHAP
ncbi:MAG: phosphotransferase [Betaproteobacteria bacterium]|nr:phosphotransferase [Betaproteobacteria bacterium]